MLLLYVIPRAYKMIRFALGTRATRAIKEALVDGSSTYSREET